MIYLLKRTESGEKSLDPPMIAGRLYLSNRKFKHDYVEFFYINKDPFDLSIIDEKKYVGFYADKFEIIKTFDRLDNKLLRLLIK